MITKRILAAFLAALLFCSISDAQVIRRSEKDPKIGTLTPGKWCIEFEGKVVCTQDAPTISGSINWQDPAVLAGIAAGINWQNVPTYEADPVWTTEKASYATTASLSGYVPTSRTISTSSGLTGGGALSGNLTLAVDSNIYALKTYVTSLGYITTDTKWDGGNVGINTTTARSTLGLGTMALANTGDYLAVAGKAADADKLDNHDSTYFQVAGSYLTGVTADAPLSGAGTSGSHLVFINPGYITGNQSITLSGDASGTGTTAITVTVADDSHAHTSTTLPATTTYLGSEIALGTETGGNYVSGVTANGMISMTGTEGATLGLTPCTGNEGYIPKWNASTGWTCQADQSASSGLATTDIDTSSELKAILTDETGSSGYVVFSGSPTITTPTIAKLANLTSNGIVRTSGGDGTLGVDTTVYLSGVSVNSPLSGAGTPASPLAVDLSSKQAADSGLTSLAGLSYASPAFVRMTGADTFTLDTTIYLTPTGSAAGLTSFPTLNQNTTGTAAGLTAQYIDWNASSGGTSIANKPTVATGANPTGTIGLTAVNGSASTFTRSDGAPALSQAIAPTWTGNHIFAPSSGNTVFSAGNVGIGTNTATSRLHVHGTGTGTAQAFTTAKSDGTEMFTILDNGNVGVGTTSPIYGLSIKGTFGVGNTTSGDTIVTLGGNVGIGTTAPVYKLSVRGDLAVGTTSAGSSLVVTQAGNVGMGSTSPVNKLEVSGNVKLNNIRISSPTLNQTSSGILETATAGENLTIDNVIYSSTGGKYFKAKADSSTTVPVIGLAIETASANNSVNILKLGFYRDDAWSWTPGGLLYLSTSSAGGLTQTRPSTTGQQIQIVGYAVSATVIYFNPDYTYVEL